VYDVNLYIIMIVTQGDGFRKEREIVFWLIRFRDLDSIKNRNPRTQN